MSIERDPEQPAFPRSYVADGHNGMTLRDYFAASALPSIMSLAMSARSHSGSPLTEKDLSEQAFIVADAMMVARLTPATEQKDRTNG